MNDRKFETFQRAAGNALLEEAQRPAQRSGTIRRYAAAAAYVCVIAAAAVIWQPWNSGETSGDRFDNGGNSQIANPWSDTTLENIRAMGYNMVLPDGAENITFTALSTGENGAEMVEADYTLDGAAYTCRAAKTRRK